LKKIAALLALSLVLGGIAYASIPDPSGVIHGCYRTQNPAIGALIVIDDATQTCPSGTVPLNWNQEGPQGATGAVGPTGPQGSVGPPNATYYIVESSSQTLTSGVGSQALALCNTGDQAVGGAWDVIPMVTNDDFARIHHHITEFYQNGYRVVPYGDVGVSEYRIQVQVKCVHYE